MVFTITDGKLKLTITNKEHVALQKPRTKRTRKDKQGSFIHKMMITKNSKKQKIVIYEAIVSR